MAKLYTTADLLTEHNKLRAIVSDISKQTTTVRRQAKKARDDAHKLYKDSGLRGQDLTNVISKHVRAFIDTSARPIRDLLKPKIREMEGIRQRLEQARDNMTNPIRRINSVTMLDKQMLTARMEAMQVTHGAGPAELEVIAESAKLSGNFGALAACVARNNQLKASDRPFTNAELLADVSLPGQDDVDAIYAELVSLPEYAMACDRAFDRLGEIKPEDKVAAALAGRGVVLNDDGSLAEFEVSRQKDHSQSQEGAETNEKVDPKDFTNYLDFHAAGGLYDDLTEEDAVRFWPLDEAAGGAS